MRVEQKFFVKSAATILFFVFLEILLFFGCNRRCLKKRYKKMSLSIVKSVLKVLYIFMIGYIGCKLYKENGKIPFFVDITTTTGSSFTTHFLSQQSTQAKKRDKQIEHQ